MSTQVQYFKANDDKEIKVASLALETLGALSSDKDAFYDGAYTTKLLGKMIYELKAAPLVGTITKETFMDAFVKIVQIFQIPGTFEYYLELFRAIWGQDVVVTFTVPSAGKLEIDIEALAVENSLFMARRIESLVYVLYEVIDEASDNILFQGTKGIQTQDDVDRFMVELVPAGIFCTTTLTLT